jgi:hypothetical protein
VSGPVAPLETSAAASCRETSQVTGTGAISVSYWPDEIAEPPQPRHSGGSPAPYLAWLADAAEVLKRRVETNAAELDRLAAEWAHVVRNPGRLRSEEISAVAESQARIRETLAADRALHQLIEAQRREMAGWAAALPGELADPALLARLLDDVAAERARATEAMLELAGEAITGAVLDLEVVRRETMRDPSVAASGLEALRVRLTGVAQGLRDRSTAVRSGPRPGDTLPVALRRVLKAHAARIRAELSWSGPEAAGERALATLPWVVDECLVHLTAAGATAATVAVSVDEAANAALRIAASGPVLLPAEDAAWLVRCRARVALAGGHLACGRAGDGSFVEVRPG